MHDNTHSWSLFSKHEFLFFLNYIFDRKRSQQRNSNNKRSYPQINILLIWQYHNKLIHPTGWNQKSGGDGNVDQAVGGTGVLWVNVIGYQRNVDCDGAAKVLENTYYDEHGDARELRSH